MGWGSAPKRPYYEEQEDTPWITRNRDMNQWSYSNVADNINRVNVFDDATRQSLNDYVDSMYNRAVSDFDRDYAQTMNRYLARDYNRLGTTGASTSLLNRDNYNLQQQRKLADMAYDRALKYEDAINQELQRRYNFLDKNYNYFTNSGTTTQAFDDANWKIRNANKDIQYLNDVADYNSKMNVGRTIGSVIGMGATAINPLLGAVVSGASNSLFAPMDVSGSSLYDVYSGQGTGYMGGMMPNLGAMAYAANLSNSGNQSGNINWNNISNWLKTTGQKVGSNVSNWWNNSIRGGQNTTGNFWSGVNSFGVPSYNYLHNIV